MAKRRPELLVLAGVNGAGKSSVLGAVLREKGVDWFNPDTFSRELAARTSLTKEDADAEAWLYGKARLEQAIRERTAYALETTLGGATIARLIAKAAATHDVFMLFCGLNSVEQHIARVRLRARHGGHDIPELRIRERWQKAHGNLIGLMPKLAWLQVFDNSADVAPGMPVPQPLLALEMKKGRVIYPHSTDRKALVLTPDWTKPIVEAAFRLDKARAATRRRRT
jgi:predicted ABC-type ATPase